MKSIPSPIRVLHLDDRKYEREGMRSHLSGDADITLIATFDDPGEFLRTIEAQAPHVAIIDMHLQGDDRAGLRVLAEVKVKHPEVRCLILTGYPSLDTFMEALDSGAEGYLGKEKEDQGHFTLPDVIRSLARGSRLYDGDMIAEMRAELELRKRPNDPVPLPGVSLTPRQIEVLKLVAESLSNQEIAKQLTISDETVNTHIDNILRALNANNRHHAVQIARSYQLI